MDNDNKKNRARMREILSVLRRNRIYKGLNPQRLRLIIEELGPTFIKLGQILSTRQDMLPDEYRRELSLLLTKASPVPSEDIRKLIETEYKKPVNKIFSSFDDIPLGAASIAQAHSGVLISGEKVVVKVQRPGIYETIERDIILLKRAAGIVNRSGIAKNTIDFKAVLDEMWRVAVQEMDFLTEANHMEEFARLNASVSYIEVPKVKRSLTTERILVMEHIEGLQPDNAQLIKKAGYDPDEIGKQLAENYIKQIFDDAFFHADPHPGNLRIRNGRIVWLDFGMMGTLSANEQRILKKAMISVAANDAAGVAQSLLSLGTTKSAIDHIRLYDDIDTLLSRYANMDMKDINLADVMDAMFTLIKQHEIAIPESITMLGRGMMILQSNLSLLSPELNLTSMLANHLSSQKDAIDLKKIAKDGFSSVISSSRKALDIPAQLSDLMKMTIKGRSKLNIEYSFSPQTEKKAEELLKKLIFGVVSAVLLLSAAIMASMQVKPIILEFSFPAMIFTLLAVILFILSIKRKK